MTPDYINYKTYWEAGILMEALILRYGKTWIKITQKTIIYNVLQWESPLSYTEIRDLNTGEISYHCASRVVNMQGWIN